MNIFNLKKKEKKQPVNDTVVKIPEKDTFFREMSITPSTIRGAITELDSYGKLQSINSLYNRLMTEDTNLDADIDTRTEALKALAPVITTELSDAQSEYFEDVKDSLYPDLVEALIEAKLKMFVFRQVEYELIDSLWFPKQLLDYKQLDLRIVDRHLQVFADDKKMGFDELKVIKILRKKAILRSLLKFYTFKAFALTNWADFTEIFGKPMRKGTYKSGATKAEKDQLWNMLKNAGTSLAMMVSENVTVEFVDFVNKTASGNLYKSLCDFCETKSTKRILGQTAVTEQEKYGSEAKAKIANLVRGDILAGDARDLEVFISNFFTRLNHINFNDDKIKVQIETNFMDHKSELDMDIKLVQQIGLPLDLDYFYDKYNRPRPEGEIVQPPSRGGIDPANFNRSVMLSQSKYGTLRVSQGDRFFGIDRGLSNVAAVEIEKQLGLVSSATQGYKDYLKKLKSFDDYNELSYPLNIHLAFGEGLAALIHTSYMLGRNSTTNLNRHIHPRNEVFEIDWTSPNLEAVHAFRAEAFLVAGVHAEDTLSMLKDEAANALLQGKTFADWKKDVQVKGFEPDNPYYVRTNFSTATNNAYLASKWNQAQDQKDIFPYLRYICMFLENSRISHKELHGTVLPIDDPFWLTYYPPNDWNCACDVEQLTEEEALSDPMYGREPAQIDLPTEWAKNTGADNNIWSSWLADKNVLSKTYAALGLNEWSKAGKATLPEKLATVDMTKLELTDLYNNYVQDRVISDASGLPLKLAKKDSFAMSQNEMQDLFQHLSCIEETLKSPNEIWLSPADKQFTYMKKYAGGNTFVAQTGKGALNSIKYIDSAGADMYRTGTIVLN